MYSRYSSKQLNTQFWQWFRLIMHDTVKVEHLYSASLALNFPATFSCDLFSGHLTYRTTTVIHLHAPRKFLPYVTWGPWAYVSPSPPDRGYGGPSTGSAQEIAVKDKQTDRECIMYANATCKPKLLHASRILIFIFLFFSLFSVMLYYSIHKRFHLFYCNTGIITVCHFVYATWCLCLSVNKMDYLLTYLLTRWLYVVNSKIVKLELAIAITRWLFTLDVIQVSPYNCIYHIISYGQLFSPWWFQYRPIGSKSLDLC